MPIIARRADSQAAFLYRSSFHISEFRALSQYGTAGRRVNGAAVQSGFDAWKAGTGSPYDLLAEDASWTIVGHSAASKTYPSKEAFISEVIRTFKEQA